MDARHTRGHRPLAPRLVVVAVLVTSIAWLAPSSARAAGDVVRSAGAAPVVYYLDIGASVSVGVQPTPRDPRGQPTNRGYANRLLTIEAAKGVTMRLTEIGCPGSPSP